MPTTGPIIRGSGPRDGFPDYIVRWLRRDKIGIFSGQVERHFKVGPVNQRIDPAWLLPANAPAPWIVPCVDASAEISDGMCIVSYRYDGSDGTEPDEDAVTYSLETSMAEKPIQTHPAFLRSLKDTYAWDDAERRFTEFIPPDPLAIQSALAGADDVTKATRNPLFGVESFFSASVTFKRTYATQNPPPNLFRGIGTIIASPPGIAQFRLNFSASKRNWLKMAPTMTKRGDLAQITENFALSHPGGWKRPIYNAGQLDENGSE